MTTKTINLALQGGGAHGAFTWGVLDRLLEDERVRIEGISATSAGAVNAAVLLDGFIDKGAAGAREALAAFWRRVSDAVSLSPLRPTLLDEGVDRFNLEWHPGHLFF
ncbi:MAG TPA: patatin-like phospholipase family protein [Candidatus Binatia bacterium]|nr:patatin-like phospholipase family protein [Candidatus Binatia bacterium]